MTERDAPAAWFGTRSDTAGARRRKFTTVFYYNNPCNEDVSRLKVISFASFGFVGVVIAQKRPRGRRLFVVPQFVVVACPASRLGPPPVRRRRGLLVPVARRSAKGETRRHGGHRVDASGCEKQVFVVVLLAVDAAPRPGVSLTFQKNLRRRVQGPVHPAADGARHRRAAVVVPDGARTDLRCATRGDWLVFEWYLSGI